MEKRKWKERKGHESWNICVAIKVILNYTKTKNWKLNELNKIKVKALE